MVFHSRAGHTASMADAVAEGLRLGAGEQRIVVRDCFDAGPDDVLAAAGVVLGTPARFGYMSGAMKDFLERIYHPCLSATVGRPYALFVKGDTDTDGAVASVERIVAGLRWRLALAPLAVTGDLTGEHLEAGVELGAAFAAGVGAEVF